MEFEPRLQCLPASQRRLWDELNTVPNEFILYGGTALALHLGHRESIDFDFFGNRRFDPAHVYERIPFLANSKITQQEPNALTVTVDRGGPIKVSFFAVPGVRQLERPVISRDNDLQVASLLDIAATKVKVVQQRAETKDYQDIDALIQDGRIDLPTALAAAKAIYATGFNPQATLKALSYFGDGNLSRLPRELQDRLAKAARDVDLNALPPVKLGISQDPGGPTQ